jgi:S-adenosylmethionine:tRNA ribosyltransferase-isomerase
MKRTDFHFELPAELIAQTPCAERAASRLLCLDGPSGRLEDRHFRDLPGLLRKEDLLVFNDTKVIPARLFGMKESGGRVEILLERALSSHLALVHARASKGLKPGQSVRFKDGSSATMRERQEELFVLEFSEPVLELFERAGEMPLPPYIRRAAGAEDKERYQTVFARTLGAVAAPTAGLHFDAPLIESLRERGVNHTFVTLHVGAGTFAPVRADDIDAHVMHEEFIDVSREACEAINAARASGGRVIAVGTTVVRSLESAAQLREGSLQPYRGLTRIFIKPGYRFRLIDALITNFHLPESTLLMLCSSFVGRESLLSAYAHAIEARYRFFSYGDAMFMTPATGAQAPR